MEITAGAQARLPKPEVQPVDLAQRMETKVEMLAQRLYEKRKEMHRLIGEKTYKGKEVSVEVTPGRVFHPQVQPRPSLSDYRGQYHDWCKWGT